MADDHVAVDPEMSVGTRIGGASTVVTLVSVAHAISHAYGALLPLSVPFFLTDLQLTYTQLGLMYSLSNLVWSPPQLGFGVLGRYYSRKVILGLGHVCQGLSIIGTSMVHGFGDLLAWRILGRIADAPQHPIIGNALISQGFHVDRRGLALAINAAGSNLGTVAVPLLGGFLIATLGWRSTLILFGLPGVLIGILCLSLLEENLGNHHQGQSAVQLRAEVWAFLIGALVDGYGFAAAFAAMAVSQVLAALGLIPVHLRRTTHAVPSRP